MIELDWVRKACVGLARDTSGNTLAIAAAALLPMTALIGGGVDVSRGYMAKTELQSACDAGVLAGRKAMSKSGSYGTAEKAKADAMFAFNFNGEDVSATPVEFITASNDQGQVTGTAATTMPTVVMQVFGKDSIALDVSCMAELQLSNADIMFVLDTTGSMAGSRIAGLRDAVRDFHKSMNEAVTEDETRIRYGFVPYSMTVNAHGLVSSGVMPTDYFRDTTPYQSRLAVFDDPAYVGETENLGTKNETYGNEIEEDDCYDYGDNEFPTNGRNPQTSGTAPQAVTSTEYDYVSWDRTRRVRINGKNRWVGWCKRRVWTTRTTYEVEYKFSHWRYQQVDVDTSTAKTLAPVSYASSVSSSARAKTRGAYGPVRLARMAAAGDASGIGVSTSRWNGCVEARSTVSAAVWDPIPGDAYDLDLILAPFSSETRWKPYWGDVAFARNAYDQENSSTDRSSVAEYCPSEMRLFQEVELSDNSDDVPDWLNDYLNGLQARGNTYHDIGLIWGGRLASERGIFADNVNEGRDDISVSRHMIFMTDGKMEPNIRGYNAYGLEYLDNRVAPRSFDTESVSERHDARFLAACEEIKAQGITLWVIAFGTSLTGNLKTCASSGRAYQSNDTTQLRNTFKFIASQVADLRLGA